MTDIVERLRSEAADVTNFHGATMRRWDEIRATVEKHKGSDLPRLMFESLVESLAELMVEGADEIDRLRAGLESIVNCRNPLTRAAVREACAEILANSPADCEGK